MTTVPLSVQLYTVREAIAADLPGTLRRIADLGFTQVEPWGFVERVDEYAELLPALGLAPTSAHARLVGQDLGPIVAAAKRLGIGTLIDPHIDDARWTTRDGVEGVAADLNAIAAELAPEGIAVGYHNHAFELENLIDGVPALEVLAGHLSPEVVLEVDTYWVEVGGQDAPELLGRLGDRVRFLHVKDGPITKDDAQQVAVGAGSMPVVEILRAAPRALPVIELDDHTGDVFTAIADSVAYLESVLG
ncbi:sugar phosphate isomerase/epimerase family protein [Frondihabitans australicus]|uniref:Sugar phosphate isomerase/epimerase n=1 Tax=Frondihabitans australicus TaxID=386892 RepID=A0A495IB13_9MICO|nr:sugar phosphate isomerase/epimerase [Frondihabitans australicus]RKR73102.1 sugar phosphate isomerase/epimerase [Frondihabitans australicus]